MPGTPLTFEDPAALGISADLAVRAGWLERLARDVCYRPNDPPALHPSIALLNRNFEGLHVGSKSALEWHGIRHYVSQRPVPHLYGKKHGFQIRVPASADTGETKLLVRQGAIEVNFVMRGTVRPVRRRR